MKRNIFYILIVCTNILLVSSQLFGQKTQPSLLAKKADTLLDQAISLQEHVGISAGIYANGEIVYADGKGFRDLANQAPAGAEMVHRIASISKPMTAVAILQLYEQGKVDLDVPVQTYVPEFPKKPEGDITVRQILTHTSGIRHYKGLLDGFSFKEYPNLSASMKRFQKRKLAGVPGEVYQYTTYGYVVLGVVIERVSGMDYETYMKQHVWEPAGMMHTSVERKKKTFANKSALYKKTKKGALKKDISTNISMKIPGGGIQSTAKDLLLFGKAILNNTLLKKETMNLMLQDPGIREGGNPYAMGWFLYAKSDDKRGRIIGHSGSQAGTSTQLMILLDKGIVISNISNTRNQWGLVFRMAWQMVDMASMEEEAKKPIRQVVSLSNSQKDKFIGTYDFGKGQILKITRKGDQLYSQMNKYPELKLYPESENEIHYRNFDGGFAFEFDGQGQVVKTVYHQGGKTSHPKKLE